MTDFVLHHADCRDELKRLARCEPELRPAMICCDPAYKISSGGKSGNLSGIFDKNNYKNDGNIVTVNMDWPEMARLFYGALPDGGIAAIMCEAGNSLSAMIGFDAAGFKLNALKMWDKRGHGSPGPVSPVAGMKNTEIILIYRKDKHRHMQPGFGGQGQILTSPGFKKIAGHPTEKPVGLVRQLIEAWVAPGELVFDPMMGAGSTGVAALTTCRRFIGCEIEAEWFEKAKARLEAVARGGADGLPSDQPDIFEGLG